LHWDISLGPNFNIHGLRLTNLLAGAAAITLVGIIQNLAIGKAIVTRSGESFDARKELAALGLANVAAGIAKGFPGSASFARSALADLAGARTRLATFVTAIATGLIAVAAAPLARYVTAPAIGGLLVATACSMIDWTELRALVRDTHDRPILITMIVCVFILPIHWAILIGLVVSLVLLLRRVSRVHLFEMVRTAEGPFREQEIDEKTGRSAITMVQLEGPLFFAHADLLASRLREIFRRGTRVTIVRMRRTQHIDFSILAALRPPVREYLDQGGHLIFCGLTPQMRGTIQNSLLGEILGPDSLLETTHEVFGSAHVAIGRAQEILAVEPMSERELFRLKFGASAAEAAMT
jgi:SulP family sulfate permease